MHVIKMASSIRYLESLELKGVAELNYDEMLGRGAYGRVYAVKYCQTICAAKEIHSILVEGVGQAEMQRTIESFLRECRQCSMLHHPNVIQFLGVYYRESAGGANRMRLPVMVMEMMADSLTSFVDKHEKIPVHIKYSIIHDVSLGLCYLHNHDPPIVHRDLSPNNVLLTVHHVAKISDLGVAKVIKADSRKTMTKAPGTIDFMPPETLASRPVYGPPMDVFSFAGILLHTFNQQWPSPMEQVQFDPKTRRRVALSELERRHQYLDKMTGEAEVLRPLVQECLDDDPAVRPTIATVCERIQVCKDACIIEYPQDVITLYQEIQQLKTEKVKQKLETDQVVLRKENNITLKQPIEMSSARSMPTQQVGFHCNVAAIILPLVIMVMSIFSISQPYFVGELTAKLRTDAPPLIPALTSGRYHIKWTQLADLPAPLNHAYAAVQHHKIYVTGISPIEDALHQVYVYDINTDQWGQLPPSGHYFGVPHIIGGKLAIIGGRLSATKKLTNKVSTFDEDSQTWTSYYPDLLSARTIPGVVSHLEYVIVAGGGKPTAEDDDTLVVQDDIEVLNSVENSLWRKASIKLPVPMYGFTPTTSDGDLLIVGANTKGYKGGYKIPVANITASINQQHNSDTPTKWTELTAADHWHTTLVPRSSPPVVVGGRDATGTPTADIKVYDNSNKSWKKIGSLSSARYRVGVAVVNDNAIVVIGGYTKGGGKANANSFSLTLVELGQVELLH